MNRHEWCRLKEQLCVSDTLLIAELPDRPKLWSLLLDRDTLSRASHHITLGGDASTSETPKAIGNLFMAPPLKHTHGQGGQKSSGPLFFACFRLGLRAVTIRTIC